MILEGDGLQLCTRSRGQSKKCQGPTSLKSGVLNFEKRVLFVKVRVSLNPIDPHPAISARKNGDISKISTFFQNGTLQKVLTAERAPIYQIKPHEKLYRMQKIVFGFDK